MPRYYLHLRNDPDVLDLEGVELPDRQAARVTARRAIADLIAEDLALGRPVVLHHAISIEDAAGQSVDAVTFGDVLRIVP